MADLHFDPPVPARPIDEPFLQTIRLTDGGKTIGQLRWHAPSERASGVIQILEIEVDPGHRRKKHGTTMLLAAVEQARRLFERRKGKLRRAWLSVEQKSQVVARGMLTHLGYHHVSTMSNLLHDQDALVYVKAFD